MSSRLTLLLIFTIVSSTVVHGQLRRGQRYSDWEPIVHVPPPINSEFDDHAAIFKRPCALFGAHGLFFHGIG